MKRLVLIGGLWLLFFFSCKKDNTNVLSTGIYIENTPVAGRSQLNFINNSLVVKSETGSRYKDTFSFAFSTGKITLTPT